MIECIKGDYTEEQLAELEVTEANSPPNTRKPFPVLFEYTGGLQKVAFRMKNGSIRFDHITAEAL